MQETKDFFKRDGEDRRWDVNNTADCLYRIIRFILFGSFVIALILIFLKNCSGNIGIYPAG